MDPLGRAGLLVVALLVVLMGVVAIDVATSSEAGPAPDPVAELVTAFERSRTATYHAVGTFERSAPDGARFEAEVEIAQRPPDRLVRQFGEVQGRRGDRPLTCPAPAGGGAPECSLGPAGEPFDEVVAGEVAAFRALVTGPDPLYDVSPSSDGCWRMVRTRNDPRSGYGMEAELCVDRATGAMRSITIDHGRVDERTEFTDISTEVTDADLEP